MFSKDGKQWEHPREREKMFRDSKREEWTRKVVMSLMISGRTFDSLNGSKQGVGEIYNIQQAMGTLPELTEKPKKSNEEAKKLRLRGNQVYKAKDTKEALRIYTSAICWAEPEGEEMAMAYANRSAVTYLLQEYQNSLEDINRAISTGKYPKNLTHKLFERRAKCFLALCQYKRASDDLKKVIVLLLQTEIDTYKVQSLKTYLDLIATCVGKQDIPMESTLQPPKLTHRPSAYIQSASAAVDIKYSPEMGRHIVATEDIAPGDILAIEKPFASVLNPDHHQLFCNNCKRRCHASIPCISCNNVVFCSELCRETSWSAHHSVECDIFHDLIDLDCRGAAMLALRSLLRVTKLGKNLHMFMDDYLNESEAPCKPAKAGFVNDKYLSDGEATHNLITHMEHRSPVEILHFAVLASSLVHLLKESTTFFEYTNSFILSAALFKPVSDLQWNHIVAANLLMRYIMASACNACHTNEIRCMSDGDVLNLEPEQIGGAIYPFLSLVNHSCDPDIDFTHYNGDILIMFSVKPIMKGCQIFSNYLFTYATHDKQTRQSQLRSHFYFTCKCPACIEDWPLFVDMPDGDPKFVSARAKKCYQREMAKSGSDLAEIFTSVLRGEMTKEQFQILKRHMTLVHKYMRRPWKIYCSFQEAIRHYIALHFNQRRVKNTPQTK